VDTVAPSVAIFGVGPKTHYVGSGWVLETASADTLRLRMTTNDYKVFGFIQPASSCISAPPASTAIMTSIQRFATTAGDTLTGNFCEEGSTILVTVWDRVVTSPTQFRCSRFTGNANACQRVF
jgi:hypothetical protein